MGFCKNFFWGAATSSYQVEGGVLEDGKGRTIWDDYVRIPGKIDNAATGDVACDHYHRFREDVALMAKLGIRNYRFSISWARILPDGTGRVEPRGIQFYSELVDCLLEHGIRPFVTLYHWDLPTALHRRGAWLNDGMPEWFAAYTRIVAEALGDRVKDFFTINEPQCVIGSGYVGCDLAPGVRYGIQDVVPMIHNLLKAHGRSVQVLREVIPGVRVGFTTCGSVSVPATNAPDDVEAARQTYFGISETPDVLGWSTSWFTDPACLGRYPEEGLRHFGKYLPKGWEEDMALIHQPLDYFAQNIYYGDTVCAGRNGPEKLPHPQGYPRTAIGWPILPEALYWGPLFFYERYGLPVIISENGMSCHDAVSLDGEVHDPNRIDYLHRYLLQLRHAAEDGVPVAGYFYWSLLDNFEWGRGYSERFGIIHVDYRTQKRTIKDSGRWYAGVIAANGDTLG